MTDRYQRGKIYKIVSDQTDQVYIGSTTEPTLACRMRGHRKDYRRHLAGAHIRVTSFDILQHSDATIVLIENFPCQSKDELRARERFYIENTPNCVNRYIPGRTGAEYRRDNKDIIATNHKKYYQANKEILLSRSREYHQLNKVAIRMQQNQANVCQCGGKFTNSNRMKHEKTNKHQKYLAKLTEAQV